MIKKILFSILIFLILVSCATKITDMNISQMEVSIEDIDGNTINSLLPDSIYNIVIKVTDTNGLEYINPNYRNFIIGNLKKLELETQAFFSLRFKTALETFHPYGTNAYAFNLSVKDNSYHITNYEYSLDWGNYNCLNFSGNNGKDGENGDSGLSASGETIDNIKGSSGKKGLNGKNGIYGEDVEILVAKYIYGDSEKLLFYEINQNKVFLTDIKPITIDTSGGTGGQGGSGGNGGSGSSYTDEVTEDVTEGISGSPGDGGDGGKGGSGGDITLFSADPAIFSYLIPITTGGRGGGAGRSGKSYDISTDTIYKGDRGKTGRDGWDGDLQFRILEKADINMILKSIKEEGFELSRVMD